MDATDTTTDIVRPAATAETSTMTGGSATAGTSIHGDRAAAGAQSRGAQDLQGEARLPVVEEELQVGKRQVERGGIRVYSRVEERPVEEQVSLREEHVHVERRPVDRPASEADLTNFKEGTIELTETAEVPVVAKEARVVEEVVVGKEATEHTETIRDTVRRTDVEVEQVAGSSAGASGSDDFSRYESDYRSNFQTAFAGNEYTFDQARPAYQFGHTFAGSRQGEWSSVESDARRDWESRNPGTWEKFKDAARYAYDRARQKMST
jgi:uncharacterized protein (TIGR02271 family)